MKIGLSTGENVPDPPLNAASVPQVFKWCYIGPSATLIMLKLEFVNETLHPTCDTLKWRYMHETMYNLVLHLIF